MGSSTIQIKAGLEQVAPVHWLPVKAADNLILGEISNLDVSIADGMPDGVLEATLRGHKLLGSNVNLPEGYQGMLTKLIQQGDDSTMQGRCNQGDDDDQNSRQWAATTSFNSITCWNHDSAPSRVDAFQRALDWLQLSKQIHAPVSQQDVMAQLKLLQSKQSAATA